MILKILERTKHHLGDAEKILKEHTRAEGEKKPWKSRIFNSKDGSKNRTTWVVKDKDLLDGIIMQLNEHLKNLFQCTNVVAILQENIWEGKLGNLTTMDETKIHTEARNSKQEGTCQWIFQRPEYKDWVSGIATNLLWVNATPGNGKTVLASAVIDELGKLAARSNAEIGLAYFYCDYKDSMRQSLSELFGCMTAQLTRQNLAIRHAVWQYLSSFQKSYLEARTVDYKELAKILIRTCEKFQRIYLVIDAADEFLPPGKPKERSHSEWSHRKALLETLMLLQKEGKGRIKIFITSRPTMEIQTALREVRRVSISAESNSEDIELYVSAQLEKEIETRTEWGDKLTKGDGESPTVKSRIVSKLVEKANGMFLFAALQLQILLGSDSSEDVLTILEELPPNIAQTWERLLLDIDAAQNRPRDRETVNKILQWLVAAARPLTLNEIRAAVAVQKYETNTELGSNFHDPQWLFKLCGPLVRLSSHQTPDKQELSLAHFSLKEFLLSGDLQNSTEAPVQNYNIVLSDANAYLAKVSLTYLSSQELAHSYQSRQELDQLRQDHKLLDYSTLHGGTHLGLLDRADDKLIELLDGLLVPEMTWQDLGGHHNRPKDPFKITFTAFLPPKGDDLIHWPSNVKISMEEQLPQAVAMDIANRLGGHLIRSIQNRHNCKAFLQLFRILSDPARKDHPVNITPLYYASLFGWRPGVEKLLQLKQDRATTTDLNHALRAAAVGGFPEIIEMLYNAGANVRAHMGDLGSPLQSATFCGQKEVVQKLLRLGAKPSEGNTYYRPGGTVGSGVQGAAMSGDTELVQLLIGGGADINCNDGWLGTALQAVLEKGKQDMARFLINHKDFKPDITGGYYGSASRIICLQSGETMSDLLTAIFDKGGDPSERVGPYGSLLEIASHFGHVEKVKLLLNRKAQLDNTSMGQFGNAIHAAAMNGDEEIVRLLLDNGADPNCPGRWLGRESRSIFSGHPEYGKSLKLQQGEGFLAYDHSLVTKAFFAPSLHASMRLRQLDHNKVFMLMENEPTHRNGHLGNPLQAVAFRGHAGVLRLLIARGARLDARGGFFGTALQAAASQGHLEVVNALLDGGANPNTAPSGHYGTALAAAIALRFKEIVRALLEKGANAKFLDDHGWSANSWCTLHNWMLSDQQMKEQLEKECKVPTAWSLTNRSPKLHIDNSGCGVRFLNEVMKFSVFGSHFFVPATVLADHPISPYGDGYFEVEIEDQGSNQVIAVGVSEKDIPTFKLPGHSAPSWGFRGDDAGCFEHKPKEGMVWPHGASWGYHGDDGYCYAEGEKRMLGWPKFGTGDTVGCCIDWRGKEESVVFFTLNGTRLEPSLPLARRRLYPAVGLKSKGAAVRANFGAQDFQYNADSFGKREIVDEFEELEIV
ncbi:ankyrin [Stipitochalara longipes BDJ]|nr:ankyrin [Stipitochalara longipes BDJ]